MFMSHIGNTFHDHIINFSPYFFARKYYNSVDFGSSDCYYIFIKIYRLLFENKIYQTLL